jgi:hypothetical protein
MVKEITIICVVLYVLVGLEYYKMFPDLYNWYKKSKADKERLNQYLSFIHRHNKAK